MPEAGRLPTLHVVADSIPSAFYRAMGKVWNEGAQSVRTQYDRKDAEGEYIDPPGRDSRCLIEVIDPFNEPRYPPVSFCEIGAYIAEIMGAKDHMVVPMDKLKKAIGGEMDATEWPYTYHQRLFAHPDINGGIVDQMELVLNSVAQTPYTRRAVADTAVPNLDPYLTEDVPCLREVQLRAFEDDEGTLLLNMSTQWRSRDLFKAWPDNVIGLTYLQREFAKDLERRMGRPVRVGSYADYSFSLHIYGQDFSLVGGDEEQGLRSFFDNSPTEEEFLERSFSGADAGEMMVAPQLEGLLTEEQRRQWAFPPESIELIEDMLKRLRDGETP